MKINILLVEDDTSLGYIIQDQLINEGYNVYLATNGSEGLKMFNEKKYHITILDVMIPKKDGFDLAKDIRKINQKIPILFLSAKSLEEDKIKGFKSGGDDYLTKPFSYEELILRVKALLKRINIVDESKKTLIFKIGSFIFDSENLILKRNSEERKLTKKEGKILKILVENKNKVLPRDVLLNSVWGNDDYFVGRSLDVFIAKIRKYLKEDEQIEIVNIHGVGFKLECKL